MTQEGYNRLRKEIARIETDEMPIVRERIAAARAEGDLSENAEYHGARESLALLQAKVDDLKSRLGRAQIIDPADMPQDEIRFGASFETKLDDGKKVTTKKFKLVGAGEEDLDNGHILVTCPLAQKFLGKKVGDKVETKVRAGVRRYEVVSITYEE